MEYSIQTFYGVEFLSVTTIVLVKKLSIFLYLINVIETPVQYFLFYELIRVYFALAGLSLSAQRLFLLRLLVFTVAVWTSVGNILAPLLYDWSNDAATIHRRLRMVTYVINSLVLIILSLVLIVFWVKTRRSIESPSRRSLGDGSGVILLLTPLAGGTLGILTRWGSGNGADPFFALFAGFLFSSPLLSLFFLIRYPAIEREFSSPSEIPIPNALLEGRGLTHREVEIARLIVQGLSNKEVCSLLGISYGTVKNHVFSIFRKLGVQSRFELVKFINSRARGAPEIHR